MKKTKNKNNSETRSRQWDEMGTAEQARWLCLLEAVNISASFAEKNGINTDKSYTWIKPSAYNAYIAETFPSMQVRLEQERAGVVFND